MTAADFVWIAIFAVAAIAFLAVILTPIGPCARLGHDYERRWGQDERDSPIEDDGSMMAPIDWTDVCRRCGARRHPRLR